jgi:hypothetical protein
MNYDLQTRSSLTTVLPGNGQFNPQVVECLALEMHLPNQGPGLGSGQWMVGSSTKYYLRGTTYIDSRHSRL